LRKGWVDVDEQVIRKRRQGKKEGRMFETERVNRQIWTEKRKTWDCCTCIWQQFQLEESKSVTLPDQATQERAGLMRINMLLGKKKGKKVDRNWMLKTKMVERQTKKKTGD